MDAAALRSLQAPIKEHYKSDPGAALITLKAKGSIDNERVACKVETGRALAVAGLHPATGGTGLVCKTHSIGGHFAGTNLEPPQSITRTPLRL